MSEIAVRGWISTSVSRTLFDGAVAIVGLDDATLIDAPSQRLAETVIEANYWMAQAAFRSAWRQPEFPGASS